MNDITPGPGVSYLFYQSAWDNPFMYYSTNGGATWSDLPGEAMDASTNSSFPASEGWYQHALYANQLHFDANDGGGQWDNNGGSDYITTSPGVFSLASGTLLTLESYDAACPYDCSDHGTCSKDYTCTCDAGFFGGACAGACPDCGDHGSCDDGASGTGTCTCDAGFDSCSSSMCDTDVTSDTDNCGACGVSCDGVGVASSSCSNGTCQWTCKSGYTLCDDGCELGDTCHTPPLPDCETFQENQCQGDVIVTDPSFAEHRWQTPLPGADFHQPSFQSYGRLAAHSHIEYAADLSSATVTVVTAQLDDSDTLSFQFGDDKQSSPTKKFDSKTSGSDPIPVVVRSASGDEVELEPLDFVWQAPAIKERDGDYRNGQKGAIVEMFGWPHEDVEQECETLAKAGYLGVKLLPAMEHIMSWQPFNNELNPWYFAYQPVSYRLNSRQGTRDQLRSLIQTCRSLGVRVYADAVVNHMTGSGNDYNPHHRNDNGGSCDTWPNKTTSAPEALQSPLYTQGFTYEYNENTNKSPSQEFPAVPYGPTDFHCERTLDSWTDPLDLNAGWLTGLVDLNTEKDSVQERIADYMTDLLSIGFSGFRVDAAKHIQPDDIVSIFAKLRRNMGGELPEDFITYWEVLLGGESDLLMSDAESGYNYGAYVADALKTAGFDADDVDKIKIWASGYPKEPDATIGAIGTIRMVVENDDADQQNEGSSSRDMGDQGSVLVKDHSPSGIDTHRGFEVKLFQDPNGATDNDNDYPIRLVLSSYYFQDEGVQAIPDGLSQCSLCTTTCDGCQNVAPAVAYQKDACGYDGPVYTRVHRDTQIIAAMRDWMHIDSSLDDGVPDACNM